MIFVFVVDTSASMNQRAANGMTLLDCAKSAVEHFVKIRAREVNTSTIFFFFALTAQSIVSGEFSIYVRTAPSPSRVLSHADAQPFSGATQHGWIDTC